MNSFTVVSWNSFTNKFLKYGVLVTSPAILLLEHLGGRDGGAAQGAGEGGVGHVGRAVGRGGAVGGQATAQAEGPGADLRYAGGGRARPAAPAPPPRPRGGRC